MPIDASASKQPAQHQHQQQASKVSKGVHMIRRHRSHTEGSRPVSALGRYRDEMEAEGGLPHAVRERLFDLFAQIEKEFENLYASNLALQERVETLTERLETCSTTGDEKPRERTEDSTDFGSKGKRAAQLSVSQKIKTTYKASTSKLVSSFRAPNTAYSLVRAYRGHRDGVWEVSVSRPCDQVIGTASADHTARLFSIETGAHLMTYGGHQGSVNAVRFHPSQDLVLTASGDHTAHVWRAQFSQMSQSTDVHKTHSSGEDETDTPEKDDLTDGEYGEIDSVIQRTPLLELTSHSDVLIAADWVAGGSQVVTASWDRAAILHDAESGDVVNMLTGHDQELSDVRAHPSQRLVVTSSKDMTFRLWDFRDSSLLVNVSQGHTQPVTSAVFASGDKVVSGSDDRTVQVWDMRNMRSPIATIRTDSAVNRISVSPTLNLIAIPHDNRHIRLYDINGVRIGRLPRSNRQGHSRMVCAVSWADENATCNLFSCGFDRQVLGWRINTHNKE